MNQFDLDDPAPVGEEFHEEVISISQVLSDLLKHLELANNDKKLLVAGNKINLNQDSWKHMKRINRLIENSKISLS